VQVQFQHCLGRGTDGTHEQVAMAAGGTADTQTGHRLVLEATGALLPSVATSAVFIHSYVMNRNESLQAKCVLFLHSAA
jgi:hypothetical protein